MTDPVPGNPMVERSPAQIGMVYGPPAELDIGLSSADLAALAAGATVHCAIGPSETSPELTIRIRGWAGS